MSPVEGPGGPDLDVTGPPDVMALVLCGGGSTRFRAAAADGPSPADKTDQSFGATTVLGHLLATIPTDWPVVAVGAPRPLDRPVTWTREQPPGGGPVAGIAAGLSLVSTPIVAVLAGDMPFAGPWAVRLADAVRASPCVDAMAACDAADRRNPLFCAYRTDALRRAVPADPRDQPAQQLFRSLECGAFQVPDEDALDVDTEGALVLARHRLAP